MGKGDLEQRILSLPCDSEDLKREMWKMMWDLHQGLWMCLNFSTLYLGPGVHTMHPQEYTFQSPGGLMGDDFLSLYFHPLLALFPTIDFIVKQEPSQLTSALWCLRAHTESSIGGVGCFTEWLSFSHSNVPGPSLSSFLKLSTTQSHTIVEALLCETWSRVSLILWLHGSPGCLQLPYESQILHLAAFSVDTCHYNLGIFLDLWRIIFFTL